MGHLIKKSSEPRALSSQFFFRRHPAEWEKQSATWLAWPHNEKEWKKKLPGIKEFYKKLISIILEFQDVKLIFPDEQTLISVETCHGKSLRKKKYKLKTIIIPNNDIWIRDYGPFFLEAGGRPLAKRASLAHFVGGRQETGDKEQGSKLKTQHSKLVLSFEFNAWGGKFPPYDLDNQVPKNLALYLGEKCESYPIILEGGGVDFNGNGLAVTTEECLLNKNRNSDLSKKQFEDILKSVFNLQAIIWLKQGLKDDHTDGHVDNVCRFIDKNKVLINEQKNNRLKDIASELKDKLNPIEIPFPDVDRKKMPSASYLNFIFVNGGVIIPTFNSPTDEIAIDIFQKVFPKKKILGIDCSLLIHEGGGLHCISKQEPFI